MDYLDSIMSSIDYRTFLKIIYQIPSCIFFKDDKLRYVFCTKNWEQQNTANIIGRTDLEIRKDRENAVLAMEADKNILKTGRGCSYVIKSDVEGGSLKYLALIKEPIFDEAGRAIGIVGLINDVTTKILFEQKLKEVNSTDALTKLYSRMAGVELIDRLLLGDCHDKAFMLIDLNKFKHINDEYGHQAGDAVLKEFGMAIKRSIYEGDIAMRLGGDEFIIVLNNVGTEEKVKCFLEKLREHVRAISITGMDEKISASVGITIVDDETTFDELYRKTDALMYRAKESGQGWAMQ